MSKQKTIYGGIEGSDGSIRIGEGFTVDYKPDNPGAYYINFTKDFEKGPAVVASPHTRCDGVEYPGRYFVSVRSSLKQGIIIYCENEQGVKINRSFDFICMGTEK